MSLVTVLWSMGAGAALALALLYGAAWRVERRNLGNLMFCLTAAAVAGIACAEVGMLHATTVAAFGDWARWYHLPLFLGIVGQLLFVRYYLGTGPIWLLWTIVLSRLVVLVGQRKALAIAVRNQGTRRRWSKLREWLLGKQNTGANAALTASAP